MRKSTVTVPPCVIAQRCRVGLPASFSYIRKPSERNSRRSRSRRAFCAIVLARQKERGLARAAEAEVRVA